ncbi:hypothetical protein [Nocardiopsis sp. NPDC057823]|uniref:hypothetical protein n=1 Tax=Nocardiopsis sp. NPDC057823 TaxID=3346256 RepID=UPI00366FF706
MSEPNEVPLEDVAVNTNALVLRHIASLDFSGAELRILMLLLGSMGPDGVVHATREDIATAIGVGDTYVSRVTTKLKKHGLAWREDHHRIRVNPHFAGRGSHEAWLRLAEALPADAPQIMVDISEYAHGAAQPAEPPRRRRHSRAGHLRVVPPV